jgi:hypothetical protein
MQARFSLLNSTINALEQGLSPARFARYVKEARRNKQLAIQLYQWNAEISRSLYWTLQALEIVCRNGVHRVLTDKYGPQWHLDQSFRRQLDKKQEEALAAAIGRQEKQRKTSNPPIDPVIADLSFGFWCALLTSRYDVPFGWSVRLHLAFPHLPMQKSLAAISVPIGEARDLRNRISHHEPLVGIRLAIKHKEMHDLIGWVNPDMRWYVEQHCTFNETWDRHPAKHLRRN